MNAVTGLGVAAGLATAAIGFTSPEDPVSGVVEGSARTRLGIAAAASLGTFLASVGAVVIGRGNPALVGAGLLIGATSTVGLGVGLLAGSGWRASRS